MCLTAPDCCCWVSYVCETTLGINDDDDEGILLSEKNCDHCVTSVRDCGMLARVISSTVSVIVEVVGN